MEGHITTIKADLGKQEEIERVWDQIIKKFKRVDILINNAAIVRGKKLKDLSFAQMKQTVDINLMAYIHLSMLFLKQGSKSEDSKSLHLVNVCSVAGMQGMARQTDYCTSKFGMRGFSQCLRSELSDFGPRTRLTTLYPYTIDTGLFDGYNPLMDYLVPKLKTHWVALRSH